ncbi:MAG: Rnf-Nqr domain containing protein, partial [Candidatus Thiodiazotropha sp.]
MSSDYGRIAKDGIWNNNIVFAQALGLCPLLAVTGTASNGLGMGLASTLVMIASGLLISLFRGVITPQVRIPVFVLIIAVL